MNMTSIKDICPDWNEWPARWMGGPKDEIYGQGILDAIRPFVEKMIAEKANAKTIRMHLDNLWLLGGEIIRDVSSNGDYGIPPIKKLEAAVDSEGGPMCRHLDTEKEQESFDATCRMLNGFLGKRRQGTANKEVHRIPHPRRVRKR